MKNLPTKISILIIVGLFAITQHTSAQSCNTIKEIFENQTYCDNKLVSLHGKVYEILADQTLQGSKYIYGFQFTDDGENIVRIVSKDSLLFIKNDKITINGVYHKKLYADGFNLEDTIVALGRNIDVILSGEEYTDLLINYVGKEALRNETLQKRNSVLLILIPLLAIAAFYIGLKYYKYKQWKGRSFEPYIENLFRKNNEWKVEQDNSYRKLSKGWVESYSNPDFIFVNRKTNRRIAIECKFKEREYERIWWAEEKQIENYQNFSARTGTPVFVVIGIGGRPKNPKRMFLVPLSLIKYPDVKMDYLQKFERDHKKAFSIDTHGNLI